MQKNCISANIRVGKKFAYFLGKEDLKVREVNTKEFKKAMLEADYETFVTLAAASGVDQASLSCIARGERKPSWETIVSISEALHLTYEGIGRVFFYSEVTDT